MLQPLGKLRTVNTKSLALEVINTGYKSRGFVDMYLESNKIAFDVGDFARRNECIIVHVKSILHKIVDIIE